MVETEFEPNFLRGYPRGSYHEELVDIPAGEFWMNVYTHFDDEADYLPSDWTVSAWAEDGPLYIWNENGRESDRFNI